MSYFILYGRRFAVMFSGSTLKWPFFFFSLIAADANSLYVQPIDCMDFLYNIHC